MATTVQAVIEQAFLASTASSAGKLAVDGELIAYLNRIFQTTYGEMAVHLPDNVLQAAGASSQLTFAGTPAIATLPVDIIDIVKIEALSVTNVTAGARVRLVPLMEKDRTWVPATAVFRAGIGGAGTGPCLVSLNRGGSNNDPANGDTITIFHVDAPAALTTIFSTLDARFPVRFENMLVLPTAIYLSVKDEGRSAERIAALKRAYKIERQKFLMEIRSSNFGRIVGNPTTPLVGQAQ